MKRTDRIQKSYLKLDYFSKPVYFTFDGGQALFRTYIGATSTIILMCAVFVLGLTKMITMISLD